MNEQLVKNVRSLVAAVSAGNFAVVSEKTLKACGHVRRLNKLSDLENKVVSTVESVAKSFA